MKAILFITFVIIVGLSWTDEPQRCYLQVSERQLPTMESSQVIVVNGDEPFVHTKVITGYRIGNKYYDQNKKPIPRSWVVWNHKDY